MSTRRAFFLAGGAVAAATTGLATTAAAAADEAAVSRDLLDAQDREAIRAALNQILATSGGWQDLSRLRDEVTLQGRYQATATVHFEVEECTPLDGDCTAVQMARLQGNVAGRRWVGRRLELRFVKSDGDWRVQE